MNMKHTQTSLAIARAWGRTLSACAVLDVAGVPFVFPLSTHMRMTTYLANGGPMLSMKVT